MEYPPKKPVPTMYFKIFIPVHTARKWAANPASRPSKKQAETFTQKVPILLLKWVWEFINPPTQ